MKRSWIAKGIKRALDISVSLFSLVLLIVPFLALALVIRIESKGHAFFRQERPGKGNKTFSLVKFRTMKDLVDNHGHPLPDDKRITKLGMTVRRWSLDELPELWNVLKGEMSLVGPRPLLMEYLYRYSREQARRHEVRPGITGWAQVNGRNALNWEERFKFDTWYVDHLSFWLDIEILALTIYKTIRREGINQPGQVTMAKFQGTGGKYGG